MGALIINTALSDFLGWEGGWPFTKQLTAEIAVYISSTWLYIGVQAVYFNMQLVGRLYPVL